MSPFDPDQTMALVQSPPSCGASIDRPVTGVSIMKAVSVEEAIAMIPAGASIMVGGFMGVGTPQRLVDEIVRQQQGCGGARQGRRQTLRRRPGLAPAGQPYRPQSQGAATDA